MAAFATQVATARSRTGKLGDKWPDTAKIIYTGVQLALTGQARRPTPWPRPAPSSQPRRSPARALSSWPDRSGQLDDPLTGRSSMSSTDTPTVAATASHHQLQRRPPVAGRRGEQVAQDLVRGPRGGWRCVLLFGYPVVKNLTMSFQDYGLKTFFTGKAPFVGLENYASVVTDPIFAKALANTALFTIGSILVPVRHRHAAGPVLPQELPAQRRAAGLLLMPWLIPLIVASADLAVDARSGQRHRQRVPAVHRAHRRTDPVAELDRLRPGRGDHGEHLDRHPVQRDPALQRPAGHPRRAVRGRRARRGHRLEGVLADHLAEPAGRGRAWC